MATTNTRYIMLFGGQGSTSIFSPTTAATAERDALSTSAGNALLSRCHAAFLEDMTSLDNDSKRKLDIDLSSFPSPSSLVRPPTRYHTHPVLQATTIFLCQLLHYLAETNRLDTKYSESVFENIQETAGFSSGILPAAVVSLSQTVDQLVACGVQAFRLALWTAARTHLYVLLEHDESKDLEQGGDGRGEKTKSPTLSLVIRGLTQTDITIRMAQYNSSRSKPSLSISAITSPSVISISGPKQELCQFQKNHLSDVTTTFAFVHGWYHGGTGLQCLFQQVVNDCERRGISFPVSLEKKKPIRSSSTRDGSLFHPTKPQDVLTWLAEHLLVRCVDWCCTIRAMADNINDYLDKDKNRDLTVKVMSFGPGSNSLFPQVANPRTQLADLSPFKPAPPISFNPQQHKDSIAIVGMSVNLPLGQSPSQLWETLASGLSAVSEIPSSRFNVSSSSSSSSSSSIPTTMKATTGCFLPDSAAFAFDNTFFSISPREALSMDPQQRMLLTAAHNALSDAGYVPDSTPTFDRSSMGCYVGLATGDYTANLGSNADNIDVYYSSGTLRAFAAGRISYFYKWSGPAMVTDTACSSSMVSIYQAVRALQGGDCKAALAGGANVITAPDMHLGLARGHFLSKKGDGCKPFDKEADGYTRAEGCVMFVLKRLEDGVKEGDRIWGVIRGVEVNQSGEASSITHPHSRTQTGLLRRLLDKTGVDVASVGVVEAHGTGTQAGDAREVESLGAVFEGSGTGREVFLGSVKGSIGHCEAASGAAGLAKLVLMLKERQIPPQVGFKTVNPALEGTLERAGLVIPTRLMPWNHHQLKTPRRALLNNFGAAGSNGSLLLEDWVESKEAKERSAYLFALSAKSEKALQWSVREHMHLLSGPKPPLLRDVCYTSAARRQVYDHRIAMSCSSVQDLVAKLKQYQSRNVSMTKPAPKVSKIVFAFAGQGSWSDGVGRELLDTLPPFRDTIEECDRIITSLDSDYRYPSILAFLLQVQGAEQWSDSDKIVASQCACVALQVSLARTFMSCGIKPDYMMGHSLGEYAALHIAGVLSLYDTLLVVAGRSRLMTEKCLAGTSGMLACNMSPEKAQQVVLSGQNLKELSVACHNSPEDCVVGGPLEQLSLFQAECKEAKTKTLDVPFAFHTSALDPILESLEELGRGINFGQAAIPVLSNVHGRFFEDQDLDSSYFALHARQQVRFSDMLECLQHRLEQDASSNGHTLFMDIGPHPTTLPMLRASLPSSPNHVYLGTLQKSKEAWKSMTESLAAICLCELPRPANWRPIFTGTSARVTSLPAHLLEGSTYLVPYQEPVLLPEAEPEPDPRIRTGFYLLPWAHPSEPEADGLLLETDLTIIGPLISGHDVGGTCICPASVFHELAIEAADVMFRPQAPQVLTVQGLRFANPLVYVPSVSQEETTTTTRLVLVRITRRGQEESAAEFTITSTSALDTSAKETEHCSGSISVQSLHPGSKQWARDEALVLRQSRNFSRAGHHHSRISTFRPKVLYEAVFSRVVRYATEYQSLTYLDVADSNLEGLGQFQVPSNSPGFGSETAAVDGCLTHPVFTDTLLHAAGFIANLNMVMDSKEQMIGICARVESLEIAYRDIDVSKGVFTIYCSLLEINGAKSVLADTVVLNEAGKVVAVVRGIEFRKLRLPVFQAALARDCDDTVVKPCRAMDMARKFGRTGQSGLETPSTSSVDFPTPNPGIDPDFIRSSVMEIVVRVGGFQGGREGISTLLSTKSLDELGIDSMMRIEIAAKLCRVFPGQALDHRPHALEDCNTLDEMQAVVLAATAGPPPPGSGRISTSLPPSSSRSNPVTLHMALSTVQSTPLVLFHDGSGQITPYARLTAHDRTTHAFWDPSFGGLMSDKKQPFTSITHMAGHYISLLMPTLDKNTPIILGGWSFGGVVAFEAATQLISRGFQVKGLVLIDVPSPVDHEPLPEIIIDRVCKGSSSLKQEFLYNASLLGMYKPVRLNLKTVMLQSKELFDTEEELGVRYEWLNKSEARTRALREWEVLTGGQVIEVLDIPGNHFGAFDQCHVDETSKQLWKACRIIEEA
ncbi:hypothetical protein QBC37DRAFT_281428 [Rhypophila decipiens]|uniref:Uncharacterized protein n=1 Tax=Rhypophila decipiens TaxID=261697 RepID=A0AAN6YBK0_9PEZI|nr:hypothetical protein QBC37DRAFT_281428 [Rhypophila decipiens]